MRKYIILTIIFLLLLFNIDIVILSVRESSILFFNKIFVSIFPFMILGDILIYFNYQDFIKDTFIGKIISKIFNINSNLTTIFILSILSGNPNNAVYVKNMLDKKLININEANNILCYSYFPSIPFVIGSIGYGIFKSIKIGILLYSYCLLNNIIIGLFLRKKYIIDIYSKENKIPHIPFFNMLKESILKAINNMFIILGNIIIFSIIINLIFKYININPIIKSILTGLLELTNGINSIQLLQSNNIIKYYLILLYLNFSGICILFQSFSILSNYKINIKRILIIKLIFSIINTIPILLLVLLQY